MGVPPCGYVPDPFRVPRVIRDQLDSFWLGVSCLIHTVFTVAVTGRVIREDVQSQRRDSWSAHSSLGRCWGTVGIKKELRIDIFKSESLQSLKGSSVSVSQCLDPSWGLDRVKVPVKDGGVTLWTHFRVLRWKCSYPVILLVTHSNSNRLSP